LYSANLSLLTGRIVLPGDPQYNSARQEFNTVFNRFPLVIVFAQETQDVANAVRWARFRAVPIRMRSDLHNYGGDLFADRRYDNVYVYC